MPGVITHVPVAAVPASAPIWVNTKTVVIAKAIKIKFLFFIPFHLRLVVDYQADYKALKAFIGWLFINILAKFRYFGITIFKKLSGFCFSG
jgi:hypothetical protein